MLDSVETYLRDGLSKMRGTVLIGIMDVVSKFPYDRLGVPKIERMLLDMERSVFRGERALRRKVYRAIGDCEHFWKWVSS